MVRLLATGARNVCGAVLWLWMCFVSLCRRLTGRSQKYHKSTATVAGNVGTSPATGQEMEWEESWNTMEPFSVTVVPSDPADQSDRSDLFQDMQPVLKKTKKVYVGGKDTQEKPGKHRFTVDTEFPTVEDSTELGVWDEEEGGGWEAEMGREEGVLMAASREAVAQHRKEEREKRRKLQEALRFNQRRQPVAGPLGTRLSDSSS